MMFGDYLRVIVKRKWIVIIVAVLVTLFTYGWAARKKPVFSSTARIKIQRLQTFADLFDRRIVSSGDPMRNYIYEIKSHRVLQRAAKAMSADGYPINSGSLSGRIKTERIEWTDLIDITAKGPSADMAERTCQAVVTGFIEDHDEMISQNAREEYEDIQKSLANTMVNLVQQDAELREKMGDRALAGAEYDQGKLLATRLTDAIIKLQALRNEGNYTEAYPEIVAQKKTIVSIKTQLTSISKSEVEAQSMIREYDQKKKTLEDMVGYLTKRLEEARIALTKKNERVIIIEPASKASEIRTAKAYLTAVGLLMGFMLGIILAFIAENLDPSIRTLAEIEETFHLPILGIVPHFSPYATEVPVGQLSLWNRIKYSRIVNSATLIWKAFSPAMSHKKKHDSDTSVKSSMLIVPLSPRAPATEGYRGIRTNIKLNAGNEKIGAILMTSSGPAEGKSTTIANLAFAFAQAGDKTLLVGANLRRPSLYRTFGLNREPGLSDILSDEISWRETVKDHRDLAIGEKAAENLATSPGAENLFIITCGGRTIQPAESLSRPVFKAIVREWEAEFDVILIDGTPLLPVPDSIIMGTAIGKVILVYQAGATLRHSMLRGISLVKNTGAKIPGLVLNDLRASWTVSPDYYHYRRYYGHPEK